MKVSDVQAALVHAKKALPAAVNIIETLDATRYRKEAEKVLQENGELLPGVETVPERESFTVKFGKTD